jgi:hypothetical protein
MARFLIEVRHEGNRKDCVRAIEVFHHTGSHFLTHADWGCHDGDHAAWMTVEVASKDEARAIVPPQYRATAKVTQLNEFSRQDLDKLLSTHES